MAATHNGACGGILWQSKENKGRNGRRAAGKVLQQKEQGSLKLQDSKGPTRYRAKESYN